MIHEEVLHVKCKQVGSNGGLSVFEYKPSLISPLAVSLDSLSLVRRIRLMLEVLRGGYIVYYLVKEGFVAGYCVITPGGKRLKCSSKQDGVVGPLYISPKFRGQGLSEVLVRQSISHSTRLFNSYYCWIYKDNIPSRRSLESCGFKPIGYLEVVGVFRRLEIKPQGEDIIYKRTQKSV